MDFDNQIVHQDGAIRREAHEGAIRKEAAIQREAQEGVVRPENHESGPRNQLVSKASERAGTPTPTVNSI
jgi:hypothetical protein